jgi:sialidase-1
LDLPEPHCQASIIRYSGPPDDTSRILFCNPAVHSDTKTHYDHEGRRNLTVYLSEDECRTWPVKKVITEGTAGYSAIAVTLDKTIICAYETLTEKSYSGEIILARFDLEWLENAD